jgi:hypothetical protein
MQVRKAERTTHLATGDDLLADISDTGACLQLKEKPVAGSEIKLELKSKEKTLVVDARVIYTKPGADKDAPLLTGIHFLRLLEPQTDLIHEMVDDYGRGVPIRVRLVK